MGWQQLAGGAGFSSTAGSASEGGITLGSRGAFVASTSESRLVPGFKVKQVATTAAGETFNGAVALAEGKSMIDAVRFANAAGALCVTRLSAQPSVPTRQEIGKLANAKRQALVHGAHGVKSPTQAIRRARVSH
jgi:sugar/nucleoside kinase (ribokinase family)